MKSFMIDILLLQLTVQKFRKMDVPLNTFLLNICGLTSLFLLPTAIIFTTDSVTKEWHDIRSAWEVSDVVSSQCNYHYFTVNRAVFS